MRWNVHCTAVHRTVHCNATRTRYSVDHERATIIPLPLYQVLLTDTTMRDAHQSLLATRVRTIDLVKVSSRWWGAS